MARQKRDDTDIGLILLGILAWVLAAYFAAGQDTVTVEQASGTSQNPVKIKAPNVAAAGAACGFAIAGGFCFVGAVLAVKLRRNESIDSISPSTTPTDTNIKT